MDDSGFDMDSDQAEEILHVARRKDLTESGGGHNQKGIEFQRTWALDRMFELESLGKEDFLFLFETIQDVAELDSSVSPSSIRIYQVKKKDRGEWKWGELTNLVEPGKIRRKSKHPAPEIQDSPIGKLYSSVLAFEGLRSNGEFISNSGCDLPLVGGGNAATSLPCDLSNLEAEHLKSLKLGLETLHASGTLSADPSLIHVGKVHINPDAPIKYLIGTVVVFLTSRSPRHAGQAQSLVEALLAKVGPLGAKTDKCSTFEELRKERGYSRSEFASALSQLEHLPDYLLLLEDWLSQLELEGSINFFEKTGVRVAASKIFRLQVMNGEDPIIAPLVIEIDDWLESNSLSGKISLFLESAKLDLASKFPLIRDPDFTALFLLRALKKCVAQT